MTTSTAHSLTSFRQQYRFKEVQMNTATLYSAPVWVMDIDAPLLMHCTAESEDEARATIRELAKSNGLDVDEVGLPTPMGVVDM
jgi:hypothetical protein